VSCMCPGSGKSHAAAAGALSWRTSQAHHAACDPHSPYPLGNPNSVLRTGGGQPLEPKEPASIGRPLFAVNNFLVIHSLIPQ